MENDKYTVCVLMSTYNGEKYLEEQIDSVLAQAGCQVQLIVRDDGSSDKTIEILQKNYEAGRLKYYTGENLKPAKSFMNLLYNAPKAEYYAFCDQDDIWMPEKLVEAIRMIRGKKNNSSNNVVMYFSNLVDVDADNTLLREKHLGNHVYIDFQSILVRCSWIFGCTQVFTYELKELVKQSYHPNDQPMHDIWVAMICAMYGQIVYDDRAFIRYRQHGRNVVGAQLSFKAKLHSRWTRLISGNEISIATNARSLLKIATEKEIAGDKREVLYLVANYKKNIYTKLLYIIKTNIFKQPKKRAIFEILLILMGKE